ncbi:Aspartyl-tRNA(Asn) amidotransferase subunit A, Glutamyl-tRNA(Gln) amidotransferase subunit A [Salinispira pacifica]|uniref:Aspartyl-tRNA(Asn) amidotransferase subunit A, Glutamyl-tRNA(Gln) amidotransferase subunit A n=1 Tax=Salinispira pacifica TaxID=1307761 RepID=V5WLJ6_9SPIO|nr:amidase family protein [Salinispira pacifica]AHC16827.1 Aspartyl-tRNA(Asn) amidotransferase subunit A, Glutamyl-tRNA(Gln) amidotransferase subunit A [Salinispira pacifica]
MKDWKASTREGLAEYRKFVTDRDAAVSAFLHFSPKEQNVQPAAGDAAGNNSQSNPDNNSSNNSLENLPYAVKDNIAVKNMPLSCGSKFLEHFVSPYDATVIQRLSAHGAVPAGKTNMDEFGMGSSNDNSALQQSHNPWDLSRVCGGRREVRRRRWLQVWYRLPWVQIPEGLCVSRQHSAEFTD